MTGSGFRAGIRNGCLALLGLSVFQVMADDLSAAIDVQVDRLLNQMTRDEKILMLGGDGYLDSLGVPRLGISGFKMTDGALGISAYLVNGLSKRSVATAFPAPVAIAASWDPGLARSVSQAIAIEAKSLGRDMLLGPCLNIHRVPHGGRNFESFSEDPWLASEMARSYVQGAQSEGVVATIKHFALNNQERNRLFVNVNVSRRAKEELYFPAFRAGVDAGAWAVMSSYNRVDGVYASENAELLDRTLKKKWGFRGFVVSDWGATFRSDPVRTARAGLDLEMPWAFNYAIEPFRILLDQDFVTKENLDDKIRRQLRVRLSMKEPADFGTTLDRVPAAILEANKKIARRAAEAGLVLLKNEQAVLPLATSEVVSLAVIGPNAKSFPMGGSGSSAVLASEPASGVNSLRRRFGDETEILASSGADIREAAELASRATVAIIFAGWNGSIEGEGIDRLSLNLPDHQEELIRAVARANPRTIVVLTGGGAVFGGSWIDEVPAVIHSWYSGQEGAEAIAGLLAGDFSPEGKLPISFLRSDADAWYAGHYPEENFQVDYAEGIYVGYRYLDRMNRRPLFPFGFGLSYSHFSWHDLRVTRSVNSKSGEKRINVSFSIRNEGSREATEVAQLYVAPRDAAAAPIDRPKRELRAFQKVRLKPSASVKVSFTLREHDFSYFDEASDGWRAPGGLYELQIGPSSRDHPLRKTIAL